MRHIASMMMKYFEYSPKTGKMPTKFVHVTGSRPATDHLHSEKMSDELLAVADILYAQLEIGNSAIIVLDY